jgi:class 3 adenylate cyclase
MRAEQLKGSEERLWSLIAERARPGANTDAIDQRIWDLFGEHWAIMFTDLSGFSRQVETFGILHFLQIIFEQNALLDPVIARHDGILIKKEADSLMIIFRRALSAMRCAIEMQHVLADVNATRTPETQVLLCVGIGFGRILRIGDHDVYGAEVNAASKLGEDTARAREILVTRAVRDELADFPGLSFAAVDETIPGSKENFRVSYPDRAS